MDWQTLPRIPDMTDVPDMLAAPYFLESAGSERRGGVPLPCRRPMRPQPVAVWTPVTMLGALVMAIFTLPRQAFLAPATIRSRIRRV
jgi:hypothetical protein